MGQSTSLPSGNVLVSYCKQHSFNEPIKILDTVDLSNVLNPERGLLNSVYEYHVRFLGGTFTPIEFEKGLPLNKMLKIKRLGHFKVKSRCYTVSLENIKKMISNFDILIAGVIIDKKFSKFIFGKVLEKVFDLVLIVGYTTDSLILKTNWFKENVEIPFEYICNIKEIHNITIQSNEEIYLELLSEC
jgi:hypothetical protein